MSTPCFCAGASPPVSKDLATAAAGLKNAVLECDYDENATNLYQAIESGAWVPVVHFLQTGQWEHMFMKDPTPPIRQARTWVTRFNPDGTVRWSQLPLHAALIFGAPKKVVVKLIELYSLGVRCTDDQQMLPLHLAVRFGSDESILSLLIDKFPAALFTKDLRGRVPTDIDGPDHTKDRQRLLRQVVEVTTDTVRETQGQYFQEKVVDVKDDLALQTKLNMELESEKKDLKSKLKQTQRDLAELQQDFDAFKDAMAQRKPKTIPGKLKEIHSTASTKQQPTDEQLPRPLPGRPSKQMHRDMVLKQTSSLDSSTVESRSRLMQSSRSFIFGRSKDTTDSTIKERIRGQGIVRSDRGSSRKDKERAAPGSVTSQSTNTTTTATAPKKRQKPKRQKDEENFRWTKSSQRRDTWVKTRAAEIDKTAWPITTKSPSRPDERCDTEAPRNDLVQPIYMNDDEDEREAIRAVTRIATPKMQTRGADTKIPVTHPGTRPQVSRRGFFQGFENDE